MSEATHTLGPWRRVPNPRGGYYIETDGLAADGYPRLIKCPGSGGAVSYSTKICEMNWSGTPEWEAIATLIAAAPETAASHDRLLAALEEIASLATEFNKDTVSIAQAAIAAAKVKL